MNPFQATLAVAASSADNGAAIVGVVVVAVVVLAVLGAAVWGFVRLRSVRPILHKSVSGSREEHFAAEVLRDFLPDLQHDPVTAQGLVLAPALSPAAGAMVMPGLADERTGGDVGVLDGFYANTLTSKPVKTAGPATGTLTSGTRPELAGAFGESVREFVEGIRSLATAVEQAALVAGGSELDRAARCVEVFTTGLGGLPIKSVLVSAACASKTDQAAGDNPQERVTATS